MITVDPRESAQAMAAIWRTLSNHSSAPLEAAWAWLCDTFNRAITDTAETAWTVAAMPTGTGKTQFAALYCALLQSVADSLGPLQSAIGHPGVLFITHFTEEADSFVANVNRHAGRTIAAAYHSKSPLRAPHAARYPVLAITHEASVRHQINAISGPEGLQAWAQLNWWQHGTRRLTMFDEAPSLAVSRQTTSQEVAGLLGSVSKLAGAPADKFEPLSRLLDLLVPRIGVLSKDRNMSPAEVSLLQSVDFHWLRQWVQNTDKTDLPFASPEHVAGNRTQLLGAVSRLQFIADVGWGWVSMVGKKATLNTSVMHPCLQSGRGVILDATASCNVAYQLLPRRLRVLAAPRGIRRYDNVTVYASKGHRLGKDNLVKSIPKAWATLVRSMQATADSSRTLVCLNKNVEEAVSVLSVDVGDVNLAHWGAINGRNQWRDHDAVAVVGLPYLDHVTPTNIVLALVGPKPDAWLQSPDERGCSHHADIVAAVHSGHVASSVLQAINRIQCRKVVDSKGNCAPTSVFILLPQGQASEHLAKCIEHSMPGVKMAAWDLDITKRSTRSSRSFDALLAHLRLASVGQHERTTIQSELGLSATSVDRFLKRSRDPKSPEHAELLRIKIAYQSTTGRGAKAYFIKS